MKTKEFQAVVNDVISQDIADVVIYMDVIADYIHVMSIDEYFDEICQEGTIILRNYDRDCYILHNGIWHKDIIQCERHYMRNFRKISECMIYGGEIINVKKRLSSEYDVTQYITWLYRDNKTNEIKTYCPHNRTFLSTIKDGMTIDEFKNIILKRYEAHKRTQSQNNSKEFEGKMPRITFNGDVKWFSMIFCEIFLLPKYANKEFIQKHKRMLCEYALERIEDTKKWQRLNIPTGFLKLGSMILMHDGTLRIQFELKINTEDD